MNIRGWVYVIANDSMPGLVKVGFSTKDPHLRAEELSSTGTPLPFRVLYDALVFSPREIEQSVHAAMSSHLTGKEWFRCSGLEAMTRIREAAGHRLIVEQVHLPDSLAAPFSDAHPIDEALASSSKPFRYGENESQDSVGLPPMPAPMM